MKPAQERFQRFCGRFGLKAPILLAPMAGACPPSLSIAIASAGGLGACGVLMMKPDEITGWAEELRRHGAALFQLNNWIPDPAPVRDAGREALMREFLGEWGPAVPPAAGDAKPVEFASQFEAMLAARPPIVSSVMGLYPPEMARELKARGIAWFANISTVAEAEAAETAGADVIVAQGAEAGGHRGCFDAESAERSMSGLFSLLPAVVDAVRLPVVATGGIADGRGVAAALMLGASAVQIGTGFLRCPEAKIPSAWADALAWTRPDDTMISRVFSGRPGRGIATGFVKAATAPGAPRPAPYPVQRGLTAPMRAQGTRDNDPDRIQAWAGQSAALARALPAAELYRLIWRDALALLA